MTLFFSPRSLSVSFNFFRKRRWTAIVKLMLLAVTLMGWVRSARADGCAALESSETGASGYFSAPSLTAGETLYIQVYSGANGSVKVQNAAKTTTYATVNAGNTSSYLVPSTATYELDYTGTDGQYLVGCGIASASSGTITTVASYPVTAPSAYNFGSVILPGSATHTLTFTIPTGGTGTIASVSVMTMGAPNLDFTEFGSDTCTGKSLASASTCTVTVQFQPLRAGWRKGGVLLKDLSGNILSAAYVQGTGTGAQLAYSYGSPVAYASVPKANMLGYSTATRFAVNGSGVLYLPTPPVSASDLEYNTFPSPYSGTAPSPTIIATGLNYPGYDTETGQNYNATYDPDALGGTYAAAVDGVGNVYITGAACDCDGNYTGGIMRIDPSGNASIFYSYAVPDSGTTPIGVVQALAVGGDGTVYVFSSKYVSGDANAGVNAFNPYTAAFSHVALSGLSFVQPYSAAIDSSANLYVSDGNYNSTAPTIYKISGTSYSVLGIGTTLAQHSSYISSIAIDSLDNLFLSDAGSSTSASSLIYVVPVSNPSSPYTISSVAGKTFNVIGSLAFDAQDNLYAEDVGVYNASTSTVRSLYYFPLQGPSLTFAAQAKGTTSAAQTVTLTNIGNAALSITVPSSGGNPSVTSTNFTLTPDTDSNACVSSSTVTIPAASICARFGTCSSVTANSCTIKPASSPHVSSGTTSGFVNVAGNLSSSQSSIALAGSGAPGVASLSFTGLPATTATGASQTTTVTALNSSNATLTGYTGTVAFSLQNSDPAASLPSAYTFQSTDNGTKTFPVALSAIGPQTVNVADALDSLSASQSTTVMSAPTGATGIFGGSVAASTGYTGVYSAQMNATHNLVVMDQSSSTSFPFDALLLTGSAYVNTQVTRLSVTNANGASIDDAGDLTYCYYSSGTVRIDTRLPNGTTPPTYTPTDNLYASGTSSSVCSGNGAGTIYFAPGDGTLTSNVPNGSSFTQTTITGTPAGITGLAMGYNGTLLLSATGGTYIGTISSGAWNGTLVTARKFYKFAAYQDLNGNVFLEDATTQAGYQETPHNGSYTEISWTKPFGVTAAAYSYNSSGSLAVASATAVNLQYSSSLTFPAIAVGTADPVEELVLKITAAGTLGSIAVTAPGATTDFTDAGTGTCTTNGTSHVYAVGDLCTVDVKFTPTRGGTRSGTVTVNGSTNNTVATASLTGTGIGPSVDHLSFTSIPSSATIGQSFNVTVTAYEDAAGTMVATSDNAQVSVTSSDSASVLPSNVVFTSGVATFAVTLNTAPSQTITATDLGGPVAVTSSNITVSSADSTNTSVTPSASTIGLGQTVNVTVTVHDLTHTNTTPTGGVSFSDLVGTTATSLNSGNPVSLSSGIATLTGITLAGDGVHTITATYAGVSGSFLSSSNTTTVTVGAATHFSVTATSAEVQGASFNATVTALDANNQAATLYAGTVKITSSDTAATLPANATLTNGVGNFTVTLNTPGSQTITATDTLTNSITGTSAAISVTAPPSFLVTVATDTTTGVAANCPNQAVTPVTGGANCSLRDALAAAATLSGTAIAVNFSPTVFLSTNTAAQNTITEVNGTLSVPSNTTIQGLTSGAGSALTNLVTVSGNSANVVFYLAENFTSAINNLTITGGQNGSANGHGGGIANGGTLVLNSCTILGNQDPFHDGGGVYNQSGATLIVYNSTFSGNTAVGTGGAIDIGNTSNLTISDSTFNNNSAGRGGALGLAGPATLTNVTITGNSASGDGSASVSGGIYSTSTLTMNNSILAANTASGGSADINVAITGTGNIYSPSGYTTAQLALAPLGNYGGPTQTMPALPTSPAFCATYTSTAPTSTTTDQRGAMRPNHETSFYCSDTGATQSSYSIVWTTQPASTIPVGIALSPVPAVQFEDDGFPLPATGTIQFNDADTSLLNHPVNVTLSSTGTASLSGSSFTTQGTGDYLHAFYNLTIGTYTPTLASASSNTFTIGPASVTATQAIASTVLTQNYAASSFIPVTGSAGTAPLSYGVSPALPTGLAMASTTGAITGTATVTSVATTYTVTVTDATSAKATATFSLTVNPAVTATQAIASKGLTVNYPVASFTPVTGSGGTGTLTYTVSPTLPPGIAMAFSTGAITGLPTSPTSATTYTVTVTDANGATATNTFSLTVSGGLSATQNIASKSLTQNYAAAAFTPVTGSGGTTPLSYSVAPALPAGLSIASSTGNVTGTPTAASSATTYTVTVTDANGATATKTFSLTVNPAVTAAQAVPTSTQRQNTAATPFTPITGGGGTGTLSYAISPTLPTGLSMASATGTISGTPTVSTAATTYTVTVTDANGATATNTFSLTVTSSVMATQAIPSTVLTQSHPATAFTPVTGSGGSAPLTYSVSPALPTGLTIASTTGAITGTPTATSPALTYTVTVTDTTSATATATFSLTIDSAVVATQAVASTVLTQNKAAAAFTPVTGSGGDAPLAYTVSPTLPTGLSMASASGTITGTATGTSAATSYTVTVTDTNGATATANFSLTVNTAVTATQSIASTILTQNHAATSFVPVTGSGGTAPLSYNVSPTLPAGLTLSSATGTLSGTPTAISSATTYTVTITDANSATATATFSLTVNSAVVATQSVATTTLTQNHAAVSFTPVTGSGGTTPLTFSVSPTLPAGLTLASATGTITGTPSVPSSATVYTVTVTDHNNATATATFSLTVDAAVAATQAVATTTLTQNHASIAFIPVTGSGGDGSLTYSISPTLPTGLSYGATTGTISGTPTAVSAATVYTVTVTDINSATATNTFTLTVDSAVIATQAVASTSLTQNHLAASFTPATGSGGDGTLTYSVSPALPAGLSYAAATGAISGTPTGTSVAITYTVTVTDINGATATATFALTVNVAVAATTAVATTALTQNHATTSFAPVTGSGGTGTLTYAVSPALPTGLSYSTTTGAITGTPTGTSAATLYTVTVTDANSATATATFSLTVNVAVAATTAVPTKTLTENVAATSFTPITGSGGTGTLTFSVLPALPAGLTYSSTTGAITGTPTVTSVATTYTVTVTDANSATASSTFSLTIVAVPSTATVSAVSTPYGSTTGVLVTATEAGSAGVVTGGIVTFGTAGSIGGSFNPTTCTLTAAGTCTTLYTPTGTLTAAAYPNDITVSFAAIGNYTAATGASTLTVTQVTPTVALASSVNPVLVQNSITLTATITSSAGAPANGDTVTFYDTTTSTTLGQGTLTAGVATLTTSSLVVGTHTIIAIFAGDTNFVTATSSAVSELVEDFSLNISTTSGSVTSVTVVPGATATYMLTISPTGATTFPANVALTISGLPAGATYTLTPSTIASGSGPTSVTLTITPPATQALLEQQGPMGRGMVPIALGLLLLPFSKKLRKGAKSVGRIAIAVVLLLSGAGAMAGLTGCGYSTGFFAQPQKAYTITVTGTSGALTHSTTVTLTVE